MKKKILICIIIIGILFGIYNIFWYHSTHMKYDEYIVEMDEFIKNKSYVLNGEDEYLYNVKLPDYLSYTGNLCVATKDGKYALLIWPNMFDKSNEYGIQIVSENEERYDIMLDENMEAQEDYYEGITKDNEIIINTLLEKAHVKWGI